MKLGQKLITIRKELPYLKKEKTGTQSYNYAYVKGSEILYKIQDKMNELGVLLYPELGPIEIEHENFYRRMLNKKGEEYEKFVQSRFVKSNGFYIWMDAETGETMKVAWPFVGEMDDVSKALGSALTYSERYFLLKFFNIPTDEDDPDKFQTKMEPIPAKEPPKVESMTKSQQKALMDFVDKLPDKESLALHEWIKKGGITKAKATTALNNCRDKLAKIEAKDVSVEEQKVKPTAVDESDTMPDAKTEKLPF